MVSVFSSKLVFAMHIIIKVNDSVVSNAGSCCLASLSDLRIFGINDLSLNKSRKISTSLPLSNFRKFKFICFCFLFERIFKLHLRWFRKKISLCLRYFDFSAFWSVLFGDFTSSISCNPNYSCKPIEFH